MPALKQPKITGVKLLRTYAHGWLWIERRSDAYWRLRFGIIFEGTTMADFIYSKWQAPLITENQLMIFLGRMIDHYEKLYSPEPYRGQ